MKLLIAIALTFSIQCLAEESKVKWPAVDGRVVNFNKFSKTAFLKIRWVEFISGWPGDTIKEMVVPISEEGTYQVPSVTLDRKNAWAIFVDLKVFDETWDSNSWATDACNTGDNKKDYKENLSELRIFPWEREELKVETPDGETFYNYVKRLLAEQNENIDEFIWDISLMSTYSLDRLPASEEWIFVSAPDAYISKWQSVPCFSQAFPAIFSCFVSNSHNSETSSFTATSTLTNNGKRNLSTVFGRVLTEAPAEHKVKVRILGKHRTIEHKIFKISALPDTQRRGASLSEIFGNQTVMLLKNPKVEIYFPGK